MLILSDLMGAKHMSFGYWDIWSGYRRYGRSVRPVFKPDEQTITSLEGTWEGDMYVSYYFDYCDDYYDASYSQICFLRDPYRYASGDGYWIDYYDNYGLIRNYIANHIQWEVVNGNIRVYFVEDDAEVVIYNYSLNDSYFTGYIDLYNGGRQKFNLRHVSSPNWGSYYWGYDSYYYYNYYSNENKVGMDKIKTKNSETSKISEVPKRIFWVRE